MKLIASAILVSLLLLTACERRQDPILKILDGLTFFGGGKYDQNTGCKHGTTSLPFPKPGTLVVGNCYVFLSSRSVERVAFETLLDRINSLPREEVMVTNDPRQPILIPYVGGPEYEIEFLQQRDRTSGKVFFDTHSDPTENKDWFPEEITLVYVSREVS